MPREPRVGDVEDVGDVRRRGRTSATASSTGAGNVLNVPNVPDGSEISEWSESEVPGSPAGLDQALLLLARWLLSAARKGAPVADTTPLEGSNNRLDVGPGAKVGSDGR